MPADARETTCIASRSGDELLVFDAGTGLRRLLDPAHASLLAGVRRVHLFLSHYHLDHTCGLAYLPGVFGSTPVTIHPPAMSVTGVDPHEALAGLLRKPYNPKDWQDLQGIEVEPLDEGSHDIAGHRVGTRRQEHSDVSLSFRVDDAFVIATDTRADPAVSSFAAGAALLLHEAWYNDADPETRSAPPELLAGYVAHSEAGEVAAHAAAAGVGRLVLIHLNPLHDEAYYRRMEQAAQAFFGPTSVLPDGVTLAADRF
jgi:ribonuclease BN (tRNA processing enzyme)